MSTIGNLIMSRRLNETIIIGDGDVVVTVVEIRNNSVRLSVKAPRSIDVHRGEVKEAIENGVSVQALRLQQKRDPARLNSFAVPPESPSVSKE